MANKLGSIANTLFMRFKILFLLLFFLQFQFNLLSQSNEFKKDLINNMINAIEEHNHIEFVMIRNERNDKGFTYGEFYAKVQNEPFKLYIKNEVPKKGSEILYIKGENDDKALVNPNSFPYISISLAPENSLLLAGGHHCVKETGFKFMSNMFKQYQKNYGNKLYEIMQYEGVYNWNQRKCHKISITYPDYQKLNYRAKEGENLFSISRKKLLNVDKLRTYNPDIDDTESLDEGQTIIINNVYAKKAVVFIDKENYFPIYQVIYDEEGIYEKYKYTNLKLNVNFSQQEFESDYKDYNF